MTKQEILNQVEVANYAAEIVERLENDDIDPMSKVAALKSASELIQNFIGMESQRQVLALTIANILKPNS